MNLNNILSDAIAAFAGSFVLGATGFTDRSLNRVEELETIITEEKQGRAKDSGAVRKKPLAYAKLIPPLVYGALYSLVTAYESSGNLAERSAISILSAFAGVYTGSAVRGLIPTRDKYVAEDIESNPERALNYLRKDARAVVTSSLNKLERRILRAGSDSDTEEELNDLNKMFNAIMQTGCPNTRRALLRWGVREADETIQRSRLEKVITDFYAGDSPDSAIAIIIGEPKKTELKVHEIAAGRLTTYFASLEGLKIIRVDGIGAEAYFDGPVNITGEETINFSGDYKSLAQSVRLSWGKYTTMFIRYQKNFPIKDHRGRIILTSFLPSYCGYLDQKEQPSR